MCGDAIIQRRAAGDRKLNIIVSARECKFKEVKRAMIKRSTYVIMVGEIR